MSMSVRTRRLPAVVAISAVSALGAIALSSHAAKAATLFTTQEDFSGWTNAGANPATLSMTPVATPDSDGSSTNGLGNTTNPLGAGTPGSLQVTVLSGSYDVAISPGEQGNPAFYTALGSSPTVNIDFTVPASTQSYFQPILLLNGANVGYQQISPTSTTPSPNANGFYTATYTLTPTEDSEILTPGNYLQLGVIMNANPAAGATFNIDNISTPAAVPEPATLLLGAVASTGLLLRKRRRIA